MSSRRPPGLSGLPTSAVSAYYASHGASLREQHLSSLKTQLSVFQSLLHQFSISHGDEIQKNPQFRAEFARMCNAIGVDPLASSHRTNDSSKFKSGSNSGGSIWAQLLGGSVNDFYFGIALRVVEECRSTRAENGGMITLEALTHRMQKGRNGALGSEMQVSEDDVIRAVKSLEPLGSGFRILELGSKKMISSIPRELNTDQSTVLEILQMLGFVTVSMIQINLSWQRPRVIAIIDDLISQSLVWVDNQAVETEYWTPSSITMGQESNIKSKKL